MRVETYQDGMHTRKRYVFEKGDTQADVEAFEKAHLTPRARLADIQADAARELEAVTAEAKAKRGERLEHVKRRKRDLAGLLDLIEQAEAALDEGDPEAIAWEWMQLGMATANALGMRLFEPEVLKHRRDKAEHRAGLDDYHREARATKTKREADWLIAATDIRARNRRLGLRPIAAEIAKTTPHRKPDGERYSVGTIRDVLKGKL